MKTVSTKHIKKLQENTKIIDINKLIHSRKYTFLVIIMDVFGSKKKSLIKEGLPEKHEFR